MLPNEPHEGGQPETRPYTLRRVQGPSVTLDVYMHDASPGNRWAMGLGVEDEVQVIGHRAETFPDFGLGAALLLGDETALPTLAALPEVGDAAEQRYLDDVCLPPRCHVSWLPRWGQPGDSLLLRRWKRRFTRSGEPPKRTPPRSSEPNFKHEKNLKSEQGRVIWYWSAEKS